MIFSWAPDGNYGIGHAFRILLWVELLQLMVSECMDQKTSMSVSTLLCLTQATIYLEIFAKLVYFCFITRIKFHESVVMAHLSCPCRSFAEIFFMKYTYHIGGIFRGVKFS